MAIFARSCVTGACFLAVATMGSPAGLSAAETGQPAPRTVASAKSADQFVREAIRCRLLGRGDADALLARAIAADPRSESAHWQSGFIRAAGEWIKYDALPRDDAYRTRVDRYETERLAGPA